MKKVAVQGFAGCFHEQAAMEFYRGLGEQEISILECETFDDEFKAVDAPEGTPEAADALVIAVENTLSGGLIPNFELLRKCGHRIKGEIFLRIEQNLMALPGQRLEDIREVHTHYMAINQTREWFADKPWIRVVESEDTALSARRVKENGMMGVGAVASSLAAELYGLEILGRGIETYKENFTRFLIVDDSLKIAPDADKATLCFTLPHKPGSLAQILTILSFYDMNLTRIQSLPIPGKEWQYFFYTDIKFDSMERFGQAVSAVRPLMAGLDILGIYKSTF